MCNSREEKRRKEHKHTDIHTHTHTDTHIHTHTHTHARPRTYLLKLFRIFSSIKIFNKGQVINAAQSNAEKNRTNKNNKQANF